MGVVGVLVALLVAVEAVVLVVVVNNGESNGK